MRKSLTLAATIAFGLIGIGQSVDAKTIEQGYVGCVDDASLDEFITAATNKDMRQIEALLGTSCFHVGGLEFSMVDRGLLRSTIRVYVKNTSAILLVPAEAAN